MKILVIAPYPSQADKSFSVFVYSFVQQLTQLDCQVVVISPQSWRFKRLEGLKTWPGEKNYGQESATVYRPRFIDFPHFIKYKNYSVGRLNRYTYNLAVKKVIKKLDFKPDLVYAHFLYRPGPAAILTSRLFKIPAVVTLGESTLDRHAGIYGKKNMQQLLQQFTGIISVSKVNKAYCMTQLSIPAAAVEVIPNAVDLKLFYPRDKKQIRAQYGWDEDDFIVAFTGGFIYRKGPLRVLKALEGLPGNIKAVFLGDGPQKPVGSRVLLAEKVKLSRVPELLSAADIFVLPTLNEGSCNAILEAIACGLPVVSSAIPAIREQVKDSFAVLVDPLDTEQIKKAVLQLYQYPDKRQSMRVAALEAAAHCSLENRAKQIKAYLQQQNKY